MEATEQKYWSYLLCSRFILEDRPDPRKQIYEPFLNTNGNRGEIINNQPQLAICNRNECFLVNNLPPPFSGSGNDLNQPVWEKPQHTV